VTPFWTVTPSARDLWRSKKSGLESRFLSALSPHSVPGLQDRKPDFSDLVQQAQMVDIAAPDFLAGFRIVGADVATRASAGKADTRENVAFDEIAGEAPSRNYSLR
jgi:hypothetical protein